MTGVIPRQVSGITPVGEFDVLVSVGTDKHRFDRLMDWIEQWYGARTEKPSLLVQHGKSRAPGLPGVTAFLDHDGLVDAMGRARVVVTHGGPASISEARRQGHVPVVVARNPAYGEHIDDHQMLFANRMAALGVIRLCTTPQELDAAIALAVSEGRQAAGGTTGTGRADAVANVGRIIDTLIAERRS